MAISSVFLLLLCATAALTTGSTAFRLQLNHVDAKANMTMAERLSSAAGRWTNRRLASSSGVTVPVLRPHGAYIAEFDIGSPPQRVQAIVDPMSDLVWTQSSTCLPKCFAQEIAYYNFSRSFTGHPVPCDNGMCAAGYKTKPCIGGSGGGDDEGTCPVQTVPFYGYGDVAAEGFLLTDRFTFGAARVEITFGCMSSVPNLPANNDLGGASGFLGLGRGALSLVSQVGGKRFSFCLTRYGDSVDSSTLFVGSSAGLGGDAPVTSTPFAVNPNVEPFSSFYYLPVTMIGFGGWLPLPQGAFRTRHIAPGQWAGGVIIDTSFPFMFLVDVAYRVLSQHVSLLLGSSLVRSYNGMDFCVAREDVSSIVPPLVLSFGAGRELIVPPENYWAPVNHETSCMVIGNSASIGTTLPWNETTIIGSFMLQNRHVLFDLEDDSISFQAADCTAI